MSGRERSAFAQGPGDGDERRLIERVSYVRIKSMPQESSRCNREAVETGKLGRAGHGNG